MIKHSIAFFLLISFLLSGMAFAQVVDLDAAAFAESVTAADLGVANPGLLPTNPFYFLKEWGRGVRIFFTFNTVAKARLESDIANQKAAELKKVEETRPDDIQGVTNALENYKKSHDRLKTRLESLQANSENPDMDQLIGQLIDRSVRHEKLMDELAQKFEDNEGIESLSKAVKEDLGGAVAEASKKDNPEKFAAKLEKALVETRGSELKHIRSVEILDNWVGKVPEEARASLEKLKRDFELMAKEDLKNLLKEKGDIFVEQLVAQLPGDEDLRSIVLEEFRSRLDLKKEKPVSDILIRIGKSLDQKVIEEKNIAQKAEEQIKRAEETLKFAVKQLPEGIKNNLTKAEANLEHARASFKEEKYGEAFGYARTAEVLARNVFRIFDENQPNIESFKLELRSWLERIGKYEELLRNRGFSEEKYPKLYAFLNDAKIHWKFAEEAFNKNDLAGVKLHLSHVRGFLSDLARSIEGEIRTELVPLQLKPAVSQETSPADGSVVSRCDSLKQQLLHLDELLKSSRINEVDYKLKYEVLRKELDACYKIVPVPATPVIKPVEPAGIICTQEYAPVCGANGKTYSNSCFAKASGVGVQYSGECKRVEPIPVKEPVPAEPAPAPAVAPTVAPVDYEFKFEADDSAFYEPYPARIDAVNIPKGAKIRITFLVRKENVYYGGLGFNSPKFETGAVKPGGFATVEFIADESFLISSVWPAANVTKVQLKIAVR